MLVRRLVARVLLLAVVLALPACSLGGGGDEQLGTSDLSKQTGWWIARSRASASGD